MKKPVEKITVSAEHEMGVCLAIHLAMQYLAEKEILVAGTNHPASGTFIWAWDNLAELRATWIREGNESSGMTLEAMAAASQSTHLTGEVNDRPEENWPTRLRDPSQPQHLAYASSLRSRHRLQARLSRVGDGKEGAQNRASDHGVVFFASPSKTWASEMTFRRAKH